MMPQQGDSNEYMYTYLTKMKSIQSSDPNFHYSFKLSSIMICKTSDYNMRKILPSIVQLDKSYLSKSAIKLALRMRKC